MSQPRTAQPRIFRLGDFQFPDSAQRLFPDTSERPFVLEIGFGDGRFWPHYVAELAADGVPQAPNYLPPNYLGVELSGVSLLKAHRRLQQAGLSNAILTKLPADVLVREVIAPHSLDTIIVNFPDPWPKAGHTDHRLLRAPFFQMAATRLKPGGSLLLTTDHDEYFEFACQEARQSGAVTLELTTPPAAALQTKYAQKWRDLGLDVHHARFVAPSAAAVAAPTPTTIRPYPAAPLTPETENAVPHAILNLPEDFAPTGFEKETVRGKNYTIVLLDLYATLRRDGWVALAHVVEGELTQEVLIGVTRREDGSTLVRLAKFGGPIITAGVKAAVGAVTDWLEGQGAVVTHRGY